ncbi:MAG: hypothetical protein ABI867_31435 [Kofleriaceae bacterium]
MSSLRPTEGARFLLERVSETATHAVYRAAIYTPEAEFTATATLGDDGSVELGPTGATAELEAQLAMQAKLLARGATKRRDDGMPAWPARLLRWRGPGRGT